MERSFVSVIVPVYKVEEYLDECIQSIIKQKYRKFELILVDDGSPDNCGVICDRYAGEHPFIKVIHKQNGGLSSARNAGIDAAQGEYIAFVDSDDFISEDYLSTMVYLANKYGADLVCCRYIQAEKFTKWSMQGEIVVRRGEEVIDNRFVDDAVMTVAWNKLYDIRLFKETNLRYPEGKIHEDNFLTPQILYHSKCMVITNDTMYFYRIRDNSIITGGFSIKSLDKIEAIEQNLQFYEDIKKEKLYYLELDGYIRNLLKMYRLLKEQDGGEYIACMNEIADKILIIRKKVMSDKNVSYKLKIKLIIFCLQIKHIKQ